MPAVDVKPLLGVDFIAVVIKHRRGQAKDGVRLFLKQLRVRAHQMAGEFGHNFLRQAVDFVVERPVAELQIMENNQVFHAVHHKGDAHRNAHRADRQQFDAAFHPDRPERADAFHRRQANHLRLVEKKLAGIPFAGVHGELRHGLAQQFADWLAGGIISHIKGIHVHHLAVIPGCRVRFHKPTYSMHRVKHKGRPSKMWQLTGGGSHIIGSVDLF